MANSYTVGQTFNVGGYYPTQEELIKSMQAANWNPNTQVYQERLALANQPKGEIKITNVQDLDQGFKVITFQEGGLSYGGATYTRQKLLAPNGQFLGGDARPATGDILQAPSYQNNWESVYKQALSNLADVNQPQLMQEYAKAYGIGGATGSYDVGSINTAGSNQPTTGTTQPTNQTTAPSSAVQFGSNTPAYQSSQPTAQQGGSTVQMAGMEQTNQTGQFASVSSTGVISFNGKTYQPGDPNYYNALIQGGFSQQEAEAVMQKYGGGQTATTLPQTGGQAPQTGTTTGTGQPGTPIPGGNQPAGTRYLGPTEYKGLLADNNLVGEPIGSDTWNKYFYRDNVGNIYLKSDAPGPQPLPSQQKPPSQPDLTGGNETPDQQNFSNYLKSNFGIDFSKTAYDANPERSLSTIVQEIMKSMNLPDVNSEYEAITKELESLENERDEKIANINNDPWLTEGVRVQREQRMRDLYEQKINNRVNKLRLLESVRDDARQQSQFAVSTALNVYQNEQAQNLEYQKMIMAIAEKEFDAKQKLLEFDPQQYREIQDGLYDIKNGTWLIPPKTDDGINTKRYMEIQDGLFDLETYSWVIEPPLDVDSGDLLSPTEIEKLRGLGYTVEPGDTMASLKGQEPQVDASIVLKAQANVDSIQGLLDNKSLDNAVGPFGIARPYNLLDPGARKDFLAGMSSLLSATSLEALINAKAEGATFGALSDQELRVLAAAATPLGEAAFTDKDGKLAGFAMTEKYFKEQLGKILYFAQLDLDRRKQDALRYSGQNELDSLLQESGFRGDLGTSQKGLEALKASIIQQESGGNYMAIGQPTAYGRALGKYQIIPKFHFAKIGLNWQSQSDQQKFLKTPALQDRLFAIIIDNLAKTYNGDLRKIAAAYYGGAGGAAKVGTAAGNTPQAGGMPSINQYVNQVLSRVYG